jgi:hypothetical protein
MDGIFAGGGSLIDVSNWPKFIAQFTFKNEKFILINLIYTWWYNCCLIQKIVYSFKLIILII